MSQAKYRLLLSDAYALAANLHREQTDKSGNPYIQHVVSVAVAVRKYGLEYEIVGLLHDAIEDTDYTPEQAQCDFGKEISEAVMAMTRLEGEDYFKTYLPRLMDNKIAIRVKYADSTHNLSKNPQLAAVNPEKAKKLRLKYQRVLALLKERILIYEAQEHAESQSKGTL